MTMQKKNLTPEQAFQKAKHYCAYQERCHSEVKEKLYSFGLRKAEVETTVARLIEEDYLNEERFAIQFAGGRFRMKQWGKTRIRHELRQKQVSEYCIRKAMNEIPDDEYDATLHRLYERKALLLKGERNIFVKKRRLQDFLLQKGFEWEAVAALVNQTS